MSNEIKKVTHPGIYVRDWIEELEITQDEFAIRLGITGKQLSLILNEEANITTDIAYKLSELLGTGPEIWLNLQMNYDLYKIKLKNLNNAKKEEKLYLSLDNNYTNFVSIVGKENEELKDIAKTSAYSNLTKEDVYSFYSKKDKNITETEITYLNRNIWASISWREARFIKTEPFDDKKLKSYIPIFKEMTLQDPKEFLPKLKEILRQCGVAFVLQIENKLANIKGLVKWLRDDKVMLTLATAQSEIGDFWITFFHELNHVLKKKKRKVLGQYQNINETFEVVGEFEIYHETRYMLIGNIDNNKKYSKNEIFERAKELGIHHAILINYLEKDELINKDGFDLEKEYYDIKVELTREPDFFEG